MPRVPVRASLAASRSCRGRRRQRRFRRRATHSTATVARRAATLYERALRCGVACGPLQVGFVTCRRCVGHV
eukprot:5908628-Pleurochrysis_carterae.AAC.1